MPSHESATDEVEGAETEGGSSSFECTASVSAGSDGSDAALRPPAPTAISRKRWATIGASPFTSAVSPRTPLSAAVRLDDVTPEPLAAAKCDDEHLDVIRVARRVGGGGGCRRTRSHPAAPAAPRAPSAAAASWASCPCASRRVDCGASCGSGGGGGGGGGGGEGDGGGGARLGGGHASAAAAKSEAATGGGGCATTPWQKSHALHPVLAIGVARARPASGVHSSNSSSSLNAGLHDGAGGGGGGGGDGGGLGGGGEDGGAGLGGGLGGAGGGGDGGRATAAATAAAAGAEFAELALALAVRLGKRRVQGSHRLLALLGGAEVARLALALLAVEVRVLLVAPRIARRLRAVVVEARRVAMEGAMAVLSASLFTGSPEVVAAFRMLPWF